MLTFWDRLLIVLMLSASVLSFFLIPRAVGEPGRADFVASISVGGEPRHRLPLNRPARMKIATTAGYCLVEVKKNRIRVAAADCPKNLCVSQGWVGTPGQIIVCLPHGLVAAVQKAGRTAETVDAVLR